MLFETIFCYSGVFERLTIVLHRHKLEEFFFSERIFQAVHKVYFTLKAIYIRRKIYAAFFVFLSFFHLYLYFLMTHKRFHLYVAIQ